MENDANRLIDGLFSRLQQVEKQASERDPEAEALINEHVKKLPAAPYYMSQTIIMQEAALKQLQARVDELEKQSRQPVSSGSFLAGLFGVNNDKHNAVTPEPASRGTGGWGSRGGQGNAANNVPTQGNRFGGSSFLGGALQTAAGVAGGMMLGNMMMNMFSGHHPEEVVDIIDDKAPADTHGDTENGALADNTDASGFDSPNFDDAVADNDMPYDDGYFDTGFDGGGFDDDFGSF